MKRLVIIVNPAAKNGASLKVWKKLKNKLLEIPYDIHFSKQKNHAKKLAYSIAQSSIDPIFLIAVGGDGTIYEVINGVITFQHVTLSYIPAGSGNDFARGFRLPANPEECLMLILNMMHGEGDHFDAGHYKIHNGQGYFVNCLGAGFDAVISKKANLSPLKNWLNKLSLGKIVYTIYLINELFRYQPGKMSVEINGETHRFDRTWFVTVSNQPYFGGGMEIAPEADPSDGELDITVVHQLSRFKLLLVFISVFRGGHSQFKEVATFKGTEIIINSELPIPIHTDGEQVGKTPVHINICPQSWKMIKTSIIKNKLIA